MSAGSKIRGREYVELLEEVASGMPHEEIAERHGRAWGTIDNFASQHRREIEDLKAAHASAISHLWITRMELRVSEAMARHEALTEMFWEIMEPGGRGDKIISQPDAIKLSAELRALETQVAEECGQRQTRAKNDGGLPDAVVWKITQVPDHG